MDYKFIGTEQDLIDNNFIVGIFAPLWHNPFKFGHLERIVQYNPANNLVRVLSSKGGLLPHQGKELDFLIKKGLVEPVGVILDNVEQTFTIRCLGGSEHRDLYFKNNTTIKYTIENYYYRCSYDILNIHICADSLEDMIDEFIDEVVFVWEQYVLINKNKLTQDAIQLRNTALELLEE